ncbi:MAG: hypothetical protein II399_01545 [Lachnospiraceae bacterium]|nr:hypothetical protein [Lachnospiraceae bacterium]
MVKIYQVNHGRAPDKIFVKYRESMVNPADYDFAGSSQEDFDGLEDIFMFYNTHSPQFGRSLSVSDVVVTEGVKGVEDGAYYCDTIGWKKIDFRWKKSA